MRGLFGSVLTLLSFIEGGCHEPQEPPLEWQAPEDHLLENRLQWGCVVPGAEGAAVPQKHHHLLHALQQVPPPVPWHASIAGIVQIQQDWYAEDDAEAHAWKSAASAVEDIEHGLVRLLWRLDSTCDAFT